MERSSVINAAPEARLRLTRIDIARGIALIAMAIYHFGWDLEFFGYMEPATTAQGGWKLFARSIAASFLFLVGFSLVLAHSRGIRWRPMFKRLLEIGSAAAAISAVTYYISPENFIFFGILHQIALASILGLLFLRVPSLLTLIVAALIITAPLYARADIFNQPALLWVGLSTSIPRSNDYVPLFPWFGAVLIGIATARIFNKYNWMPLLSGNIGPQSLQKPLSFIGRHGLAFYLIHQPVLIALIYAFSQLMPAPQLQPREAFAQSCEASCNENGGEALCKQFCGCVIEELDKAELFEDVYLGRVNQDNNALVQDIAAICSPVPKE